jgi:hypothetical protein
VTDGTEHENYGEPKDWWHCLERLLRQAKNKKKHKKLVPMKSFAYSDKAIAIIPRS